MSTDLTSKPTAMAVYYGTRFLGEIEDHGRGDVRAFQLTDRGASPSANSPIADWRCARTAAFRQVLEGSVMATALDFSDQGQTASTTSAVFTNCGKAGVTETLAKPAKRKLTRVPFTVSRLMEFCTKRELTNQTGHDTSEWSLVVLKELVDNALDECEEAGVAPVIQVEVNSNKIVITDNGRGIPVTTIQSVLDYSIRVSSREAYVSPTRGAQGNALKTILPMGYVLDERRGEDASGETLIEAYGIAHHIKFSVDHIRQEPRIEHTCNPSSVVHGTRITVDLPGFQSSPYPFFIEEGRKRFLILAEAYAWLNPHLSFRVVWNGDVKLDVKASNPTWCKWLPSWPTSPHWYDESRLRRYMAAHIANRGNVTVQEFISEFRGLSATSKQKKVLLQTGASHVSLHDFFGRDKANGDNIAKLLGACCKHSKPVRPAHLGVIGKEHLYRLMEATGGDPKTFTYNRSDGGTNGVPRVVEFAFGIHRDGLTGGHGPSRKFITGVNWSPGIKNPFQQLGRGGEGLDAILAEVRANTSQPVMAVLHLACPRVAYTDRGKSAIVVEGDVTRRGAADGEEE
jgi:DNA topoisomerase VI subunit B